MYQNSSSFTEKRCVPCEGGIPAFTGAAIKDFTRQLQHGWQVENEKLIRRTFKFPDFAAAMTFGNKVDEIAETAQHHPDLHISRQGDLSLLLIYYSKYNGRGLLSRVYLLLLNDDKIIQM